MNCKNCGYPLFSNDKFCKNCGLEVVRESDVNPVVPEEPKINDGPIEPVVGNNVNNDTSIPDVSNKPIEPVVSNDKIDGPRGVNNVMSMEMPSVNKDVPIPEFDAPKVEVKEENSDNTEIENTSNEPQLANVNQDLPSLPNDKKTTSSVIIPTKPQPMNNNDNNNNTSMNQPMNNNNNGFNNNNNYNNPYGYGNNQYNNQFNNYNNQYNNPNNQVPEPKKSSGALRSIVLLIVLILLGVGGYFGYKYLVNNGIIGGKETTKDVSYSGYKFSVPDKYKTQVNANSLSVYDDSTILSFSFVTGSYGDISTSLIVENFTALGNTASYLGEKEKDGNKYHLFQVKVDDKNGYVGYIASGATKIICFSVEPKNGTALPSEEYLNKAVDISLSATYNGASNIEVVDGPKEASTLDAAEALIGEAKSTGDISDEDVYEDIYVNITLNEINE